MAAVQQELRLRHAHYGCNASLPAKRGRSKFVVRVYRQCSVEHALNVASRSPLRVVITLHDLPLQHPNATCPLNVARSNISQ